MQIQTGMSDLWLIAPMIMLLIGSIVPITVKVFMGNKEPALIASAVQGAIAVIAAGLLVCAQWGGQGSFAFSQALVLDGITSWASLLTLVVAFFTIIMARDNKHTKDHQYAEQVSLILSSALGMLIVASSNDLIVSFIGIELMSLATYVLIGISLEQKLSKEAAFKYFILGSFGSAFLLYGIALIYGGAGTTMLSRLGEMAPALVATNKIFLIGAILLLVGMAFKVSVFPFHAWTPDVYQGAPTPITAFMAAGVKVVMFAMFSRIAMTKLFTGSENLQDVLQWLAVLTVLGGNLAAIRQSSFKRMLAYSSISHSGYVMIGIIAAGMSESPLEGVSSVVFYLVTYTAMTLGAFALASLYEKTEHGSLLNEDLKGLAKRNPLIALALTVLLLSMAGLPPTAGFFGKLFVFSAAVGQGLFWLATWGVIGSVIGVYFYLKPIVNMYMYEPAAYFEEPESHMSTRAMVFVSAIFALIVGVAASPVFNKIITAVESSL